MPDVSLPNDRAKNLVADLNLAYPHSAQRYRYYVDGSREFIIYGNSTGFTDNGFKTLTSSGGSTHEYRTAQNFIHVAGRESRITTGFKLNRLPNSGERVVVGYGNPDIENDLASADGWLIEIPPGLNSNEVYFNLYRNGSIISNDGQKRLVQLENDLTDWNALTIRTALNGHFGAQLLQTSVDQNFEQTETASRLVAASYDGNKGPQNKNAPITYAVKGDGLEIDVGDAAFEQLPETAEPQKRFKEFGFFNLNVGTTGTFVPIAAARQAPSQDAISGVLQKLTISNFDSNNATLTVLFKEFDPSKVNFAGTGSWSTPTGMISSETSVQVREDVDQFADNTGTLVTSTADPGGTLTSRTVEITGSQSSPDTISASENPRNFFIGGNIGVALVNTDTTGNVSLEFQYSEEW